MEGLKRISTQNLTALSLVARLVARAADASPPPFQVEWDFKPALQSGATTFYPVIALRRAAGAGAAAAAAAAPSTPAPSTPEG